MIAWFLKYWPVFAILAAYLAVTGLMRMSYNEGARQTDEVWKAKETQIRLERAKEIREIERAAEDRQREIAGQYERELAELKAVHEQRLSEVLDRNRTELRGVVGSVCADGTDDDGVRKHTDRDKSKNTGRLPAAGKASGGFACYPENRLRRQIAETVAIAQECDREMKRFQKLIEACK